MSAPVPVDGGLRQLSSGRAAFVDTQVVPSMGSDLALNRCLVPRVILWRIARPRQTKSTDRRANASDPGAQCLGLRGNQLFWRFRRLMRRITPQWHSRDTILRGIPVRNSPCALLPTNGSPRRQSWIGTNSTFLGSMIPRRRGWDVAETECALSRGDSGPRCARRPWWITSTLACRLDVV